MLREIGVHWDFYLLSKVDFTIGGVMLTLKPLAEADNWVGSSWKPQIN